jgi:hypothetical protein
MVDKESGHMEYAVLQFGGFLVGLLSGPLGSPEI